MSQQSFSLEYSVSLNNAVVVEVLGIDKKRGLVRLLITIVGEKRVERTMRTGDLELINITMESDDELPIVP